LLLIAAACVFQALAAREVTRDPWRSYWIIDAAIGIPCLLGAWRLLRPGRTRD
jgi:hypothetical protein